MKDIVVDKVWLTDSAVWIRTTEGKEACEKFADYPRLKYATSKEREEYMLSPDGIHWENIGEDLSFEGFFAEKNTSRLYKIFVAHPELNASAIARRMGLSQSLFAQYVSGTKKPSQMREQAIMNELKLVGQELQALAV